MRLFLVPIAHRHTLLYAQRVNRQLTADTSYVDKIAVKASAKWVEWEAAEKGWQKKVTEWGNSAFSRIPYQEWGLKSIPPLSSRRKASELKGKEKITVRFPPDIIKPSSVLDLLRQLATERQTLHRKSMWWSIAGLPIALPFGLLPIIPNLPFFYLAFRAWSHWRALNGSKHIEFLLDNDLIRPSPSDLIQKAYNVRKLTDSQSKSLKAIEGDDIGDPVREKAVRAILNETHDTTVGNIKTSDTAAGQEQLPDGALLVKGSGKLIAGVTGLPILDVEIERALAQIERATAKEEDTNKSTTTKTEASIQQSLQQNPKETSKER